MFVANFGTEEKVHKRIVSTIFEIAAKIGGISKVLYAPAKIILT